MGKTDFVLMVISEPANSLTQAAAMMIYDSVCSKSHRMKLLFSQVLTTGSWPGEQVVQCILPHELSRSCEQFKEFYTKAYSGRRLIWQTNKGSAGKDRSLRFQPLPFP